GWEEALVKTIGTREPQAPRAGDAAPVDQQIDRGAPIDRAGLLRVAAGVPAQAAAAPGVWSSLAGATEWINSAPLTAESLRGKVVVVDFWTYSCINCLRTLPYVRAWAEKYKDAGLVVIGVHAPEFSFERRPANVRRATKDLHIDYPVVI